MLRPLLIRPRYSSSSRRLPSVPSPARSDEPHDVEPVSPQHHRLLTDAPTSRTGASVLTPAPLRTPDPHLPSGAQPFILSTGPLPLAPAPPRARDGLLRSPASLGPRPARPRHPAYRSERRLALGGGSQRPATARGPRRWEATSPTSSLRKTEQRMGRGQSRGRGQGRGREGREGGGGRVREGVSEGGSNS